VQELLSRSIVLAEQIDLHLCLGDATVFVKPLPAYLLSDDFWRAHLCADPRLHAAARGLLLSYAWLVCSEADFALARDKRLLPDWLTWEAWSTLIAHFLAPVDLADAARRGFDRRYRFGELRVRRLNLIYRLAPDLRGRFVFAGYFFGEYQFDAYFRRNFSWLLIAFAYTSVVISAMQLGLATSLLSGSEAFQWASYVFAVISIIVPVIAVTIIFWVVMFLSIADVANWVIGFVEKKLSSK
jgi:hypothetical protein